MTRELIPAFTKRGSGHFVFVSSISGKTATARASLYAATKFGIRGFALCLRDDLRPAGVGVSVVSPGAISGAGMFADSGAAAPPLIGTGKPDQVGAAVVSAIERNRGEVTVAPLRQRVLARFAANAPELSSRLAGDIAAKAADEMISDLRFAVHIKLLPLLLDHPRPCVASLSVQALPAGHWHVR